MSASGNTTTGDLPPSSRVMRFMCAAEPVTIDLPTRVEPVNEILLTSGWSTSACPAVEPNPVTTFTTPGGKSASSTSCASRNAVSGASSAGLSTTVQPAASAGPILFTAMRNGAFHGVIAPTTPIGSRSVNVNERDCGDDNAVSPVSLVAQPAL